jgi:hypothetical protein
VECPEQTAQIDVPAALQLADGRRGGERGVAQAAKQLKRDPKGALVWDRMTAESIHVSTPSAQGGHEICVDGDRWTQAGAKLTGSSSSRPLMDMPEPGGLGRRDVDRRRHRRPRPHSSQPSSMRVRAGDCPGQARELCAWRERLRLMTGQEHLPGRTKDQSYTSWNSTSRRLTARRTGPGSTYFARLQDTDNPLQPIKTFDTMAR